MNYSDHCLEFSKKVADDIFIIKVVLGSLGMLVSLFVFLLIGATKIYKQFVYRLVMYLMVVNAFLALCQVLELIPIVVTDDDRITLRNGTAWPYLCSAFGYLEVVSTSSGNLIIIWTVVYMLILSRRIRNILATHDRTVAPTSNQDSRNGKKAKYREVLYVFLILVMSFLFSWIPFVKDMYGPSGPLCWIKTINTTQGYQIDTTDENYCGDKSFQHWSIALMMAMLYGPVVITMAFGFVCMIVVISLPWKRSKHLQKEDRRKYKTSMNKIGFVLVYPVIYWIFCSFLLANRIYSSVYISAKNLPPYYPLWIIYAVADPARIVMPALVFLLHPYAWKKILTTMCSSSSHSARSLQRENSLISADLSIRRSDTDYGSMRLS